jgi:hypothetical protein
VWKHAQTKNDRKRKQLINNAFTTGLQKQCCSAKKQVAFRPAFLYINSRRVSLLLYILGRFLPKLGGASAPPFFAQHDCPGMQR